MSRFDLLYEQSFTSTSSVEVIHNLNRRVFNVRLIITGGANEAESQRHLVEDITLDSITPLDKLTVILTGTYTGIVQLIAEDTIQSPYYTVEEKLASQEQTDLAGTAPTKFEYNGQGNPGRVLEYVSGISSDDAPFIVVGGGYLVAASFGAVSTATGTIGIYAKRPPAADVLLYTISYTNSSKKVVKPLSIELFEDDEIYVKVLTGSVSKPYVVIYTQTI